MDLAAPRQGRSAPAAIDRLRPHHIGLLLGGLFLAIVAWTWLGFLASDDVIYARGAEGWLQHFPYVGGHGTIRYPITVPMAISFRLFGSNEFAMVLPSLLYMLGLLWLCWRIVARSVSAAAANIALLLMLTMPLVVVQSSIANIDVVETLFLFASLGLFVRSLGEDAPLRGFFLAGVAAGVAFLSRETAIFSAAFYGVLFLAGYGVRRRYYWAIAAGFMLVWAAECTYLAAMTGDPLYRFNISLHHDSTINRSVDLAGNVLVHPAVDPLLVLLINQDFMLLFWAAIPAALWLCFAPTIDARVKTFARLTSLFGLTWFLCVGAAVTLLPLNPRYFLVTALTGALVTGVAAHQLIATRRHAVAAVIGIAALTGLNVLGLLVENRQTMFAVRELVAVAASHPGEPIRTDPVTRHRALLLLEWKGAQDRVQALPPRPGELFLYNPASGAGPHSKPAAVPAEAFVPQPEWQLISRHQARPDVLAIVLETLGLSRMVPRGVWEKLSHPHAPVLLYRAPIDPR